ncbi:YciI family protein [Aquimarina rhabdastrellae]
MKQYMYIIRGGEEMENNASPEEMQEHMEKWQEWMGDLAQKDQLIGGEPLMNEARSLTQKGQHITDRPLAEGKELVGGYIIVKANSLDEATALAKGCPGFEHDCTIEVREIRLMD